MLRGRIKRLCLCRYCNVNEAKPDVLLHNYQVRPVHIIRRHPCRGPGPGADQQQDGRSSQLQSGLHYCAGLKSIWGGGGGGVSQATPFSASLWETAYIILVRVLCNTCEITSKECKNLTSLYACAREGKQQHDHENERAGG